MWVYLDIETLDLTGKVLLQISAVTEDNNRFNVYINPPLKTNKGNNITQLFAYNGNLYKKGRLLPSFPLQDALKLFRHWISEFSDVRICAFNGFGFDFRILIWFFHKSQIDFPPNILNLCDPLPAIKRKLHSIVPGYRLAEIATHYKIENSDPHNGLSDAVCLKNICDAFTKDCDSDLTTILTPNSKSIEHYLQKIKIKMSK